KERIEQIYSLMDFKVTHRKYKDADIIELKNKETQEILYTAFVDNHYVASYSSSLVEASIQERLDPVIGLDPYFIEANKHVANKGLYRIFVNYAYLPQFLSIYTGQSNSYTDAICNSMAYAGMNFQITDEKMELKGHSFLKDTIDPYVSAFLHSGKQEIRAQSVLSDRTALYTHIGFDNPATFIKELETALSANPSSFRDSYQKNYKRIESLLDISLTNDFLSWMSGELAIAEMEPGMLGRENEIILAVRAKDIHLAKEKMAFIEKKVKKRTPINIKTVNYKDFAIQYIELKGFFNLFFGKMLDKFEKPYYTYMGDYVVFSNKPASLLSLIEDYERGQTLEKEEGFRQVHGQVDKNASYFVYLNTPKFFQMLKPILNAQTWANINAHKEIANSFAYPVLHVTGNSSFVDMQLILNYRPWKEEIIDTDEDNDNDETMIDNETDEISELNRFYAEKFQGNVYREFYPEGAIKSECEIKNGIRHGKYHEYYETGGLYIRGKYKKGIQKGTWKYYTQDGKLDHKEKKD
ncbi:MAG: DUF3352 domain-containing protein, partial [Dysgonamonadaceae bacterium]|nr:DUF3352 domain-containing protein [Dysgonamonadaceae bacterium]